MARMYPSSLDNARLSTVVRNLYMLFRDELDDSYLVFFDVAWSSRSGQPGSDREADFVIVHRDKGVLVLEVKDWASFHYDPQTKDWTIGQGDASLHVRNPVEQVKYTMFHLVDSVKGFLQEQDMGHYVLALSKYVGYALAFPNHRVDKSALVPVIAPEIVLDEADLAHIRQWTEQAMEYWHRFYSVVRIRIVEEPLTVSNLNIIISSLTELSTKYWLIAKGRFADLIEYTQTHNERFAEETNVLVTKVGYNSPFNMDLKVDLSAPSVADALVKTIDGIKQRNVRLEQAELENQKAVQEMKHAEQLSAHEQQMAVLEQEQKRLEVEQRRLETLEKQLEVQKKIIENAMEMASKMVDLLHPGADPATRAMEIQVLLPNLVQLQNGKGLELALPAPQENQTKPTLNG